MHSWIYIKKSIITYMALVLPNEHINYSWCSARKSYFDTLLMHYVFRFFLPKGHENALVVSFTIAKNNLDQVLIVNLEDFHVKKSLGVSNHLPDFLSLVRLLPMAKMSH